MGENTEIQWCTHTFNGWLGCAKVSPACDFCYAERGSARLGAQHGLKLWDGDRYHTSDAYWRQPFAWNRKAAKANARHRVFCASFSDVFEDREDLVEPRDRLMRIIEQTPNLDWLLLTKRPENMVRLSRWGMSAWPKNVWAGTTAESQEYADRRIPHLLNVNASVHFVSYEPALGLVNFENFLCKAPDVNLEDDGWNQAAAANFHNAFGYPAARRLSWIIVGGESGPKARSFDVAWARSVIKQCDEAGVACFVKQLGAKPWDSSIPIRVELAAGGTCTVSDLADPLKRLDVILNARLPNHEGVIGKALNGNTLALKDSHGGDLMEWADDLRVRQFPTGAT